MTKSIITWWLTSKMGIVCLSNSVKCFDNFHLGKIIQDINIKYDFRSINSTLRNYQEFMIMCVKFNSCQVEMFGLNSFSAGDVILRLWSCHCCTAGHVIFRNNQVPYAFSTGIEWTSRMSALNELISVICKKIKLKNDYNNIWKVWSHTRVSSYE